MKYIVTSNSENICRYPRLIFPQTFLSPVDPDEVGVAGLLVAGHGDPGGEDVGGGAGAVQAGVGGRAAGDVLRLATHVVTWWAAGVARLDLTLVQLLVQLPAHGALQREADLVVLGTHHLLHSTQSRVTLRDRLYLQTQHSFVHLHVDYTHHHDHAGQEEDRDDGDNHKSSPVPDQLGLLLSLHAVVVEVPVEEALRPVVRSVGPAHHSALGGGLDWREYIYVLPSV